jgi:hypothetical protein
MLGGVIGMFTCAIMTRTFPDGIMGRPRPYYIEAPHAFLSPGLDRMVTVATRMEQPEWSQSRLLA